MEFRDGFGESHFRPISVKNGTTNLDDVSRPCQVHMYSTAYGPPSLTQPIAWASDGHLQGSVANFEMTLGFISLI
jgi:hypothetical protein